MRGLNYRGIPVRGFKSVINKSGKRKLNRGGGFTSNTPFNQTVIRPSCLQHYVCTPLHIPAQFLVWMVV